MIARGEREMRVLRERDPVMALLIARCGALIGGIKRAYGFENRKPPVLRSPEEALLAPLQRGLALLLPGQRRCGVEAAALIAGMPARMPVSASRAVP